MGFLPSRFSQLAPADDAVPHGGLSVVRFATRRPSFHQRPAPRRERRARLRLVAAVDRRPLAKPLGGRVVRGASFAGRIGRLDRGAQGRPLRLFRPAYPGLLYPLCSPTRPPGKAAFQRIKGTHNFNSRPVANDSKLPPRPDLFRPRLDVQTHARHLAVRHAPPGLLALGALPNRPGRTVARAFLFKRSNGKSGRSISPFSTRTRMPGRRPGCCWQAGSSAACQSCCLC